MKKKKREPWTGYWELYATVAVLFIIYIAFWAFTLFYLAGKLGF